MTMRNRSLGAIFSALTLSTALAVGVAGPAQAEEPVSTCNESGIFAVFNTSRGQTGFGNDGCVYSIINGAPLAIKNYDLEDGREAERFSREYNTAQSGANRQAERDQRDADRQQQRCQNSQSRAIGRAIDSILSGRDVRTRDAGRVIQDCALRR